MIVALAFFHNVITNMKSSLFLNKESYHYTPRSISNTHIHVRVYLSL